MLHAWDMRNAYKVLFRRPEWKRPLDLGVDVRITLK
jgi:hypothetical protein